MSRILAAVATVALVVLGLTRLWGGDGAQRILSQPQVLSYSTLGSQGGAVADAELAARLRSLSFEAVRKYLKGCSATEIKQSPRDCLRSYLASRRDQALDALADLRERRPTLFLLEHVGSLRGNPLPPDSPWSRASSVDLPGELAIGPPLARDLVSKAPWPKEFLDKVRRATQKDPTSDARSASGVQFVSGDLLIQGYDYQIPIVAIEQYQRGLLLYRAELRVTDGLVTEITVTPPYRLQAASAATHDPLSRRIMGFGLVQPRLEVFEVNGAFATELGQADAFPVVLDERTRAVVSEFAVRVLKGLRSLNRALSSQRPKP